MDFEERLLEFVVGLRAAGVRISVAESADGFRAIGAVGARFAHRLSLRTANDSRQRAGRRPHLPTAFPFIFRRGKPTHAGGHGGDGSGPAGATAFRAGLSAPGTGRPSPSPSRRPVTPEELEQLRQQLRQSRPQRRAKTARAAHVTATPANHGATQPGHDEPLWPNC